GLEALDERFDGVVLGAADLLVPQHQGHVAEGGDVGVDLVGRGTGALAAGVTVAAVRAGRAGRQDSESAEGSGGAEEAPSSHDVLLKGQRQASSRPLVSATT